MKNGKKFLFVMAASVLALITGCQNNSSSTSSSSEIVTSSQVTTSEVSTSEASSTTSETPTTSEVVSSVEESTVSSVNSTTSEASSSEVTSNSSSETSSSEEHVHAYGNWVIVKAPTLTEAGTAKRTCECNDVDLTVVPALSNTEVWSIKSTTPADHFKGGVTIYESVYGEVTVTSVKGDHTFGAWTIVTEPTLTAGGKAERTCSADTYKEEVNLPALTDTEVWSVKSEKAATHLVDGEKVYTSVYGDVTVVLPKGEHTYGSWTITTEPTANATGKAEKVCSVDNHKVEVEVPALSDATVWKVQSFPGATHADEGKNVYTSIYGKVEIKIPAGEHVYGAWTITTEPTATATGKAEKACTVTGCTHVEEVTLPALSDTTVWKAVVTEPTHTEAGYTTYKSVYGEVVVDGEPATGHTEYGAWTLVDKPTTTVTGSATRTCSCGHVDEVVVPVLTDTTVWKAVVTEPTHTEAGYTTYTSVYGEVEVDGDPALGHTASGKYTAVTEDGVVSIFEVCEDDDGGYVGEAVKTMDEKTPTSYTFSFDCEVPGETNSAPWTADEMKPYIVTSGGITHNQSSILQVTVGETGTFVINYKISSETTDKLIIRLNGTQKVAQGGDSSESSYKKGTLSLDVTEGDVITFIYHKDGSVSKGNDHVIITLPATEFKYNAMTFNTNGGSEVGPEFIINGVLETDIETLTPTKEGKYFGGWFIDEECTVAYDNQSFDGNSTLHAKWLDPVIVTYVFGNGEGNKTVEFEPGNRNLGGQFTPTREGYYFEGWYLSDSTSRVYWYDVTSGQTLTLEAHWSKAVTLTFDTNGGSTIASISNKPNSNFNKPTDPTKQGYKFGGWYTDEATTTPVSWKSSSGWGDTTYYVTLNADVTYYAKWIAQYTVTYKAIDGTVIRTETCDEGEYTPSVSISDIPSGYMLGGFYTSNLKDVEYTATSINANTVIYVDTVSVVDVLGEDCIDSAINGDKVNNKTNCRYVSISKDENGIRLASSNATVSNSESTLSMIMNKATTVSFDYVASGEGGSYDNFIVYVIKKGTTSKVEALKVSSKTNVSGSKSITLDEGDKLIFTYYKDASGDHGIDGFVVTKLKFSEVKKSTITYVYHDGVSSDTTDEVNIGGTLDGKLAAPTAPNDNMRFAAWYLDAAYETVATESTIVSNETISLHAKWDTKITVSFVVPEGATAVASQSVFQGDAITVVAPSVDGRRFVGWFMEEEHNNPVDLADGLQETCTVYALYEEIPEGASKDSAKAITIPTASISSVTVRTTEVDQEFFLKFTLTEAKNVNFSGSSTDEITLDGGNNTSKYYGRYNIYKMDTNEKVVSSDLSIQDTSETAVFLEAGDYYIKADLGAYSDSAHIWGLFTLRFANYPHDSAKTAIELLKDTIVTIAPGTFISTSEKIVYKFVATADGAISAQLNTLADAAYSYLKVYNDETLKTQVASISVSSSNAQGSSIFAVTNGSTYYVVLSNRWDSKLATGSCTFTLSDAPLGAISGAPISMTTNSVTVPLNGLKKMYYKVTITEENYYAFTITGGKEDYTKYIQLYRGLTDSDSNKIGSKYEGTHLTATAPVKLVQGDYLLEVGYSNSEADNFVLSYDLASNITNPYVPSMGYFVEADGKAHTFDVSQFENSKVLYFRLDVELGKKYSVTISGAKTKSIGKYTSYTATSSAWLANFTTDGNYTLEPVEGVLGYVVKVTLDDTENVTITLSEIVD